MIFAITKLQVIRLTKTIKNLMKKDINASCIVKTGMSGLSESVFPTL
jgi:hypothetical protein